MHTRRLAQITAAVETVGDAPPARPDSHVTAIDRALVDRIRAGDRSAFETLFREMHATLVAFASRYVGDDRAEELVQELFLDLWATRERWEVHGSVRAYLFTAARHRGLNARRRDAVERDWEADEARDDVRALHPRPVTPDVLIERDEQHAAVSAAFALLPERCRLAMQLRWRDGLSYAEIAEVLGISVKGVENQLGRGLKALRHRLGVE
jgi:RNA polymerase sigma-70 factor, ECF subfamily